MVDYMTGCYPEPDVSLGEGSHFHTLAQCKQLVMGFLNLQSGNASLAQDEVLQRWYKACRGTRLGEGKVVEQGGHLT